MSRWSQKMRLEHGSICLLDCCAGDAPAQTFYLPWKLLQLSPFHEPVIAAHSYGAEMLFPMSILIYFQYYCSACSPPIIWSFLLML